MKRLLLGLLPARAATQIAVIVAGALILANIVTATVLLLVLPTELRRLPTFPYVAEIVALAKQRQAAPTGEARAVIEQAALAANSRLSRLDPAVVEASRTLPWRDRAMQKTLQEDLGPIAQVLLLEKPGDFPGPPAIGLRFADGSGLAMAPPAMTPPPRGMAFIIYLIVMLACFAALIGLLSLWAARAVVSPLSQLAAAADRFDPDRHDASAIDQGPSRSSGWLRPSARWRRVSDASSRSGRGCWRR